MLTSAAIARGVARIHATIGAIRDELNEADRHLGDGDTGMTIERIVNALNPACAELPADVGAALAILGRETSRASGSSLGAVLSIGINRAAKLARGREAVDQHGLAALLRASAEGIVERSGASPGDKSVLDSIERIAAEIENAPEDASLIEVAAHASTAALDAFRGRESRLGRARMFGTRSIGIDDPGMLAVQRLLEAARDAS